MFSIIINIIVALVVLAFAAWAVDAYMTTRPKCRQTKRWARGLAEALQVANPGEVWGIKRVRVGFTYEWIPERKSGGA